MNPAMLVIDVQRAFYDDKPKVFRTKLLPNIAAALHTVRSADVPVVHVITRYRLDGSDWPRAWRDLDRTWCQEGSEGTQILAEARPLPGDPVVVKTRFSGSYRTALEDTLRERGIDTLLIAGYSSDVCVRLTAMDAYNRDYDLYLLSDCVHADRENTEESIRYLEWLTRLRPVANDELAAFLSGQR